MLHRQIDDGTPPAALLQHRPRRDCSIDCRAVGIDRDQLGSRFEGDPRRRSYLRRQFRPSKREGRVCQAAAVIAASSRALDQPEDPPALPGWLGVERGHVPWVGATTRAPILVEQRPTRVVSGSADRARPAEGWTEATKFGCSLHGGKARAETGDDRVPTASGRRTLSSPYPHVGGVSASRLPCPRRRL